MVVEFFNRQLRFFGVFVLWKPVKKRCDVKVETVTLEYVFDTDDCELYFVFAGQEGYRPHQE